MTTPATFAAPTSASASASPLRHEVTSSHGARGGLSGSADWAAGHVGNRHCSWCNETFAVVRRPGRPRLYCGHACRQRAYEHRHGFKHRRTLRSLPGQDSADRWTGTGYERGGFAILDSKAHALRPSARPEGSKRETLCGLLMPTVVGHSFNTLHPKACASCSTLTASHPLRHGIHASNELARLRSVIDDVRERRTTPAQAMRWIANDGPSDSRRVVVPDRVVRWLADVGAHPPASRRAG